MPVQPLYCAVCGLPAEFCEYGPNFEACKPWLIQNCPELYPQLVPQTPAASSPEQASSSQSATDGLAQKVKGLSVGETPAPEPAKPESSEAKADQKAPEPKPSGGKGKKKDAPTVVISLTQRSKRKFVTVVNGLEHFGVKLSDASKQFAKKLSCGASVVKAPAGHEEIDIQGDNIDQVVSLVLDVLKIPAESVFIVQEGKKVPAKA